MMYGCLPRLSPERLLAIFYRIRCTRGTIVLNFENWEERIKETTTDHLTFFDLKFDLLIAGRIRIEKIVKISET